jgi:hypothetical protein
MEDLTLALVTLTAFVLLFVVAVFADRAGADLEMHSEEALVPVERSGADVSGVRRADVA